MKRPASIRRARRLRQSASLPERKAWAILRKLRHQDLPVRRQHPIAGLTVDFAIRSRRLAIEIDGPIHRLNRVKLNDAERDTRLRAAGWTVLRISDEIACSESHLVDAVMKALGR